MFINSNIQIERRLVTTKVVSLNRFTSFFSILFCVCTFSLPQLSCERDNKERGREYFPDMTYSETYETYATNPIFSDGKTAQPPVKGTIPRHMVPYQYSKTREGKKLAGEHLINPYEANEENLVRGQKMYAVFCANCHGFDGKGDGNLYASGRYPSEPPSLITEEMLSKPEGEYYHIITVGSAIMGPFASLIRPEDKWKIILYIKTDLSKEKPSME